MAPPQTTTPPAPEARRRHLLRLQRDVGALRARLAAVAAATRTLGAAESVRPLTAPERAQVTRLRLEAETLRLELRALAAAFEATRRGGGAGAGPRVRAASSQ